MIKTALRNLKGRFFPPFKDISDEFLNRLFCANAGMLHKGNLLGFDHAIKNLPKNSVVLEIGAYCGLSTNVLIYYLQKYQQAHRLFTCDSWEFFGEKDDNPPTKDYLEKVGNHPSLTREVYMDFVKNTFVNNVKLFGGGQFPYAIEMKSESFFNAWDNQEIHRDLFGREVKLEGEIGFCFIDGDHTKEGAWRDWENVNRHLKRGGFVLFDDSGDGTKGNRNAIAKSLLRDNRFEFVFKNPNYLFRKI